MSTPAFFQRLDKSRKRRENNPDYSLSRYPVIAILPSNALIKEKSDTVQRGDFTRDLSHEIYGSYISHRINMLYLWGIDDPEIANMFKHLNMGEMTGDATKTIKNFTNEYMIYGVK